MRLSAIGLIVTLALGILAAPLAAEAQQPGQVPRIGFVEPGSAAVRHKSRRLWRLFGAWVLYALCRREIHVG